MNKLSDDLLFYLFNYFHQTEQNELRLVCKQWSKIIKPKSLEYRLHNKIKPFEINVNKNYYLTISFFVEKNFIFSSYHNLITKTNKLNNNIIQKRIFNLTYVFSLDDKKILAITNKEIKIINKKNLTIIEEYNFYSTPYKSIIYKNKILYAITNLPQGIIRLFDVRGKLMNNLRSYDYDIDHIIFGYRNRIYGFCNHQNFRIWKFNSTHILQKINFPFRISGVSYNNNNFNLCVLTSHYQIYVFNKKNKIIYKLEDNSMQYSRLLSISTNNYFMFSKNESLLMYNNMKIERICSFSSKDLYFCDNNILYKTEETEKRKYKIIMY